MASRAPWWRATTYYNEGMDRQAEMGAFLKARRAATSPVDADLPEISNRRVAGLRREEVAMLAGLSVDYYVRLEQGRATAPSEQVLDAVARALRLDALEREHLGRLAAPPPRSLPVRSPVRPDLVALVARVDAAAYLIGPTMDVLAGNAMVTYMPTDQPSADGCRLLLGL
jgi:transcriptional regulator with XRE-family HTH domain